MGRLEGLKVNRVSLVDEPATRRKFILIKRKGQAMDKLIELIKSLLPAPEKEGEKVWAPVAEFLKAMSDEAQKAITSALTTLNAYKDEFPSDIKDAIATLAKYATGYGYPAPKSEQKSEGLEKKSLDLVKSVVKVLQEAIGSLNSLLPGLEGEAPGEEVKDAKSKEKPSESQLPADLADKLKSFENLEKRLAAIEQAKGVQKSLDEDVEDEEEGSEDSGKKTKSGVKWPSFHNED